MSDGLLRETTVSLDDLADRIRTERIPEIKADKEAFVEEVAASEGDPSAADKQQFQQFNERIKSAAGTAESLEHYAAQADGEPTFTLRELNADQFAAVLDKTEAAGEQQRREGLPNGVGMVESIKRGVVDCPDGFDADPGAWPAALVGVLHGELDDLTTADASEVELGNESLGAALAAR